MAPDSYSLAFNWYRLTFGKFTKKNLFIKLCLDRNFTGADKKFIEYCLNDKECECIVVHFDGTCFTAYQPNINANRRISLNKYNDGDAVKCIKYITGASPELHPAQTASNKGNEPEMLSVVNDLLSNLSQEEQDELYANRKFIYEVVIPANKYNPSDIDAIFLNQFNKIEIFEFKRKKQLIIVLEGQYQLMQVSKKYLIIWESDLITLLIYQQ
ncbi:hypothetical protein [Photobacterium leiognathi]|uniref:hypothetical protein n=1 Tax=Photobacterium leiognathi TaxID=553611 RepID=UPI000D1518D4|nr:hypothetical protein [Photobacterium leiognathi]PSW43210.1 hypothetical protein C0W40_13565 [Photobacterium leiognathi subsp. mandapamensis]